MVAQNLIWLEFAFALLLWVILVFSLCSLHWGDCKYWIQAFIEKKLGDNVHRSLFSSRHTNTDNRDNSWDIIVDFRYEAVLYIKETNFEAKLQATSHTTAEEKWRVWEILHQRAEDETTVVSPCRTSDSSPCLIGGLQPLNSTFQHQLSSLGNSTN